MTNNINYIYKYINTINAPSLGITLLFVFWGFVSTAQNYQDVQLANEYMMKGDRKKALELYRDLSKNDATNQLIYNNYFNLLLDAGEFDEANAYLKRNQRKDPN